ncbi:MAG: hypothetical protein GX683_07405, partial [Ruminococcaceae bacterium]|nr:hypothetical protein [Oscillospiraceae bacterium]
MVTVEKEKKKIGNKPLRIFFATLVLLLAFAFSGYILYSFHFLEYIPKALSAVVRFLCVCFWGYSVGF